MSQDASAGKNSTPRRLAPSERTAAMRVGRIVLVGGCLGAILAVALSGSVQHVRVETKEMTTAQPSSTDIHQATPSFHPPIRHRGGGMSPAHHLSRPRIGDLEDRLSGLLFPAWGLHRRRGQNGRRSPDRNPGPSVLIHIAAHRRGTHGSQAAWRAGRSDAR